MEEAEVVEVLNVDDVVDDDMGVKADKDANEVEGVAEVNVDVNGEVVDDAKEEEEEEYCGGGGGSDCDG